MTSPVSIPSGHKLVGTDFDAYENLTAVWTSYTPTWTSTGTQPVLGNGTLAASYIQAGKLVIYRGRLDMGSTTTFGTGVYNFSLPVAFASPGAIGPAYLSDATGIAYPATCAFFGASLFLAATGGNVTNTNPFTWAVTDSLFWTVTYEAA